jgi:hypothetical protein
MSDNDTATERPKWANDAMNDDDIAFLEGYADAIGWLPSAKPEELVDFLCLSSNPRLWFKMMEDHTLARYKGWSADPDDTGMVGVFGGNFNKNGVEIGYTAGISAALRIHRPELDRKARATDLGIERKKIQHTLARQQAALAKVEAELAALDGIV